MLAMASVSAWVENQSSLKRLSQPTTCLLHNSFMRQCFRSLAFAPPLTPGLLSIYAVYFDLHEGTGRGRSEGRSIENYL